MIDLYSVVFWYWDGACGPECAPAEGHIAGRSAQREGLLGPHQTAAGLSSDHSISQPHCNLCHPLQTSSTASAASSQPGNGNPRYTLSTAVCDGACFSRDAGMRCLSAASSQVVLSEEALVEKRLTGTGDGGRRPERPLSTPVLDLSGVPPPGAGEQSSPQPRPRANSSSQSTRSPVVTSV